MKRAILPVSLGLAGLALTVWLFWGLFANQRADVAVARSFLTHIAASEFDEANTLISSALDAQLGAAGLQGMFGAIEPWEALRFRSRDSNGIGEDRTTVLRGTGSTPSGCASILQITLIGGLIDAFSINPLCPATVTDA